ncbi:hypothetical protein NC796_08450 [Aliifodinibius sp. S!AR15-10]|nr:hypothetical protein [Aliifodinibius sp. S!AR15-10]
MKQIYEKVKTPHKYGLVLVPEHRDQKVDCRSVFRSGDHWYMTYIVYEGRGYETWLAESEDLVNWTKKGRMLSFSDSTRWDANQNSGDVVLRDHTWGGSYRLQQYQDKYWMSYYGGTSIGYEAGKLSISIAYTEKDPSIAHEWIRLGQPVLAPDDDNASWWDNAKMYKSTVLWDKSQTTGHPFVMYYNALGDSLNPDRGAERIGMAVSDDMRNWQRYGEDPVLNHHDGITGNPAIQKMGDIWVMFYFGAFYGGRDDAWNSFAASYDLVNWTDWTGLELIEPSESYDARFAHKPIVINHEGTVYHFYCAVNKDDQRGIALATSTDLGKSDLQFPKQ